MIRIGITGPESSGKTTLAKALSEELGASYISEFARKYLTELGRPYEQNDLIEIAKGQLNGILTGSSSLQIIDTDFIVLKIWLEEKYNSTSAYIEDLIAKNHFDLHILCTPDIPWEEDSLRENPDDRDRLFKLYLQELIDRNKSFIVVKGSLDHRLIKSTEAIHSISK